MAVTAWKTFSSGAILTASDMNIYSRDNGRWLSHHATGGAPMCRVHHSTNQTITSGSQTVLNFDIEIFDDGAMHDTSTNNSRITIPTGGGGVYLAGFEFRMANTDQAGTRYGRLLLNGTTGLANAEHLPTDLTAVSQTTTALVELAAADYIEVAALQNSGANLNTNRTASYTPIFWAIWVGE